MSWLWACRCHVMQTECVSDSFSVPAGVRQGCREASGRNIARTLSVSSSVTRPRVMWSDHRSTDVKRGQTDIAEYQRDKGQANTGGVSVLLIRTPSMDSVTNVGLFRREKNKVMCEKNYRECSQVLQIRLLCRSCHENHVIPSRYNPKALPLFFQLQWRLAIHLASMHVCAHFHPTKQSLFLHRPLQPHD